MLSSVIDGLDISCLACGGGICVIEHWLRFCHAQGILKQIRTDGGHHAIVGYSYVGFGSNVAPLSSILAHCLYMCFEVNYSGCV